MLQDQLIRFVRIDIDAVVEREGSIVLRYQEELIAGIAAQWMIGKKGVFSMADVLNLKPAQGGSRK